MGLRSERRTIGEHEYEVTQLPSSKGRRLLVRLFKVLGPAFGELTAGGAKNVDEVDSGALARAIQELALRITSDDLEDVVQELARTTRIRMGDKEPELASVMELHFAGRYDELIRWLAFALEVNYGSFFGGLAGLRPRAGAAG